MKSSQRQQIIAALEMVKRADDAMACPVAAALIISAVVPQQENSSGAIYYRVKSEAWLSMLLASEPAMSLEQLAERVQALAACSERVKGEIGGLAGRLRKVATEAA